MKRISSPLNVKASFTWQLKMCVGRSFSISEMQYWNPTSRPSQLRL